MVALLALMLSLPAHAALKNDSEAGVVVTNGNTRTQTFSLKQKNELTEGKNTFVFTGSLLTAKTGGVESAEAWLLGVRYERALTDRLSAFLAQNAEGDKFAGVLQRYNTDLGAKYFLAKREKDFLAFAEGGYRFTKEHSTKRQTQEFQKARAYAEAQKYFSENVSSTLWAEYIPNFTVSQNWLLNSELSLSAALNTVFAVKSAFLLRYNNAPPLASAQKADTTFTTALTAKF